MWESFASRESLASCSSLLLLLLSLAPGAPEVGEWTQLWMEQDRWVLALTRRLSMGCPC